ncbi:LLM class flavin-dependent oxidoreductase [Solihabitans fulvus]|uniref:LLM class flavin-dependent oxidoreductase n=1 Tax=Solihabitans fulvus TaxID=1892852 RepID=A0A5B2WRI3_9PSEU|nr:LLM class flavin-dependent oxidoreductase [Solihabitans fulvus]KAA2252577.1 LLM class flavin-dependent oxidoreductase [Solihabitans fulvus]
MEFGVIVQTYTPRHRREGDPEFEHTALFNDIAAIRAADRNGVKYAWATEHHFLDEYSHLSASGELLAYLAHATERIHLGSAIFNPLAPVNHPAKVAERVAMLDHLTEGRFEFGTGRGAGSHEILGFIPGMTDLNGTKEIWEETIAEFPKMFLQEVYEGFQGKHWSLPPRRILPKPYGKAHPAMWYAAGSSASYAMAAHKGLGVLGFNVGKLADLEAVIGSYKGAIPGAEPVGAFVNDNVVVVTAAFVDEDGAKARAAAVRARLAYQQSNVFRYHDSFPRPEGIPPWPQLIPDYDLDGIEHLINEGTIVCGDPDEAREQCERWRGTGLDQLVFAMGLATPEEDQETLRLLGEHVIPGLDTDPVHSTTRFRQA